MFWRIIRLRVWVARRRLCGLPRSARVIALGLLVLVVVGAAWGYRELVGALASERGAAMAMGSVSFALPLLLMVALLNLGEVLQRLYLSADLELLMVAPIPLRHVFAAKLVDCSRALWLPGLVLMALFVALGDARGAPAYFPPLALLLVLAAVVLTSAISMALVMVVARLMRPQRLREWIPVALGLLSLVAILGQQTVLQRLAAWEGWGAAAEALLQAGNLALGVALAVALALATVLGCYWVFRGVFYRGWSSAREAPIRRPAVRARLHRRPASHRRHLLIKEWRALRRDPRQMSSVLIPPLTMAAFAISCLASESSSPVLIFWLLLIYGSGFGLNSTQALALTAVGQEGRNMALLRSSPLPVRTLLSVKLWASWIPASLVWSLVLLFLGAVAALPAWQILLLVGALALGLAGASAAATAIGALGADFAVEEPNRRVNPVAGWLTLVLAFACLLLTALSAAWIAIRLYPTSDLVVTSELALGGYPVVGWLFGEDTLPGWALAGGQAVSWAAVVALWGAGVRRLERWEVGG